jgi:hypothetical protein
LGPGVDPMDDEVENFVDAPDHQSPPAERAPGQDQALGTALLGTQEGALGTQPGPEYVQPHPQYLQYARRSKKVDVKKLKTELWGRIGFEVSYPFSAFFVRSLTGHRRKPLCLKNPPRHPRPWCQTKQCSLQMWFPI